MSEEKLDPKRKIEYVARYNTVFSGQADMGGKKFTVEKPNGLPDNLYGADCIEFGAWHALQIHPTLNGFQGYDATKIEAKKS